MRYSLCSVGNKTEPLETIIPRASALGYEGIELWSGHLQRYSEDHGGLGTLASLLEENRLQATVIAGYSSFLTADDPVESALSQAEVLLGYAAAAGAPYVRLFLDWIGSDKADDQHWRIASECLRLITSEAGKRGITIVMETHQGQLTDTTSTTLRLLESVGSDHFKVNLDIYNLFEIGEDPLDALDTLWPYTVNVHLKNGLQDGNGPVRYGIPLREGNMDFTPIIRELLNRGYSGFAAVEWFGDRFWEAAREELRWLNSFLSGGDLVERQLI